jgi:hypothetical protein
MRDYLFHVLDWSGRSVAAEIFSFDTDEAAIRHALGPVFGHGCELWDAYRLVGRFCGPSHATIDSVVQDAVVPDVLTAA